MKSSTYSSLFLFIKRLLIVFLFYQVVRVAFYLYNRSFFPEIDFELFLGGIRFDLSTIGYINLIFGVLHLFPGAFQENKRYQKTLFLSFFSVNALFISLNFIDFEYFRFIGRRSSFSMMTAEGMEQEILGLMKSYIVDYWQIPLIFIGFNIALWYCLRKINNRPIQSKFSGVGLIVLVIGLGCLFILGRGISRKPLRIVDASLYGPNGSTSLVLNTPFTVLTTLSRKETLEKVMYFPKEVADSIFNPIQSFSYAKANKKNVVLIILESFGHENIRRGQTPFLDSLITKSFYFENGFANGKLSIDAVPSTISSVPNLMNTSYISSSYSLNKIYALPEILRDNGYSTAFFHGAFNGSQNFDQYASVAGFDNYYGKNEYRGRPSFDGKWGVFDEDFLQFSSKKMNEFKQPFFSTIFTISSHPPFTIPVQHQDKFPKGTTEIHESIAYADFALKAFFETARNAPWFNNTLFVITADHTSSSANEAMYKNNIGKFRIPILFYRPFDESLVGVSQKNFQQIDILPSLMDYLQLNTKVVSFGKSYKSNSDFVVNYLDNVYNLEIGDHYLAFDGKKSLGLFNWKIDPLLKNNLMNSHPIKLKEMEVFIKAYIQSYNSRVSKNELVINR